MLMVMMVGGWLLHGQHKLSCMLKAEFLWERAIGRSCHQDVRDHLVKLVAVKVLRWSAANCVSFELAAPHFLSYIENLL